MSDHGYRRLRSLDPENWDYDWIANPRCQLRNEPSEAKLIARRSDILVLGEIRDAEASYSYDDWALIKLDSDYYLLSTVGCSCPDPSETWSVQMGPTTLQDIRERLVNGDYNGYTVPGRQMSEFLEAIDKAIEVFG